MKFRVLILTLSLALLSNGAMAKSPTAAYQGKYKAVLLLNADTGKPLLAENIDRTVYPASVVKLMTALLTLEAVESGDVHWKDVVEVSRKASRIGGSQVYLKQGERFALQELTKAMIISSANDAAYAISEYLGGTSEDFVFQMNERARQLGMNHTRYTSPHGLPPGRNQKPNITTARDLSLLAQEVLKHPTYFKWSSTRLDSFRKGTFQLLNTNHKLLRSYDGMDGMKTGYYRKAGFNLVATAHRNGERLISIVIGSPNSRVRNQLTAALLDSGFQHLAQQAHPEDAEGLHSLATR